MIGMLQVCILFYFMNIFVQSKIINLVIESKDTIIQQLINNQTCIIIKSSRYSANILLQLISSILEDMLVCNVSCSVYVRTPVSHWSVLSVKLTNARAIGVCHHSTRGLGYLTYIFLHTLGYRKVSCHSDECFIQLCLTIYATIRGLGSLRRRSNVSSDDCFCNYSDVM